MEISRNIFFSLQMDRVPRIPPRLSTLFPERHQIARLRRNVSLFPRTDEETEREREVATQGKEVPSRPRTGPDFISCAFVFRSDYSRGHKRKIRYVQDTSYYNYVKDPVTYGGRTRIRSSLPCSTLPPFAPSYPHRPSRCPRPLESPSCLPLVTSCSRFGRKFARIRRIRKSGSSRTSTGEPVGRAHARLTICRI